MNPPTQDSTANQAEATAILKDSVRAMSARVQEQKLQEAFLTSERRYRSLIFATAQIVWVTSPDGNVTEDLPTWREFSGQTTEQLMGRGWMAAVHPDDRGPVAKVWEESLLKKVHHVDEFRVRRADGVYRLLRSHAVPILNEEGDVIEWIGSCRDVTDQHEQHDKMAFLLKANELLSKSLDYKTTLESIAQLVVERLATWCTVLIREDDGSLNEVAIAHADPKMVQMAHELGKKYPPNYDRLLGPDGMLTTGKPELIAEITDEMLVKSARDEEHLRITRSLDFSSYMGVPLVIREKVLGVISFFAAGGVHFTEEDLEFAQGLARKAALAVDNSRLYRDAHRAFSQLQELNKRLEAEVEKRTHELQEAQAKDRANFQRLRSVIRRLPLAAIAIDENAVVLEVNTLFCQLLGFPSKPEDMIGHKGEEFMEAWKQIVIDSDSYRINALDAHAKPIIGQEIFLKDGRVLVRDFIPIIEEGKQYGFLMTYRDITQERRIDATKSEFMSLASHQLRTPLTVIRWIFGRLGKNLADQIGPLEQNLLQDGRAAAARMSETINTMLQISRIQAGQVQISREAFHLRGFLEELVHSFAEDISLKSLRVTLKCPYDLLIATDLQFLREVMVNLLSNAIKYTPEKGTIFLSVTSDLHSIAINVQDTGYGIPRHQQNKVFHKFFRGDNVVSKDPDGTGLGLHMVSLITELLGGTIGFESIEGSGTTFQLQLPRA